MNKEEQDLALDINALLMAFYTQNNRALGSIINDSDQPMDLLLGGIATLINIVDELLHVIEDNVDEVQIDFETMIQIRGEVITESEIDEE